MSTPDQNLDLQTDGLRKAGCEKICSDKISGAKAERPWLGKALELSRAGDTLVIWRLDRLVLDGGNKASTSIAQWLTLVSPFKRLCHCAIEVLYKF